MAILAEFGFAELAVLQIGQDARNYVDVTAVAVLELTALAYGQAVANVTASASAGDVGDSDPQAVNNTTAAAILSVMEDWTASEAFMTVAGGSLRMAPLTSSGYGLTATATASWVVASNIQPLLDAGFDGLWTIVADFYSSVFAHVVASGSVSVVAAGHSSSILLTSGAALLAVVATPEVSAVNLFQWSASLRVQGLAPAQSLAATSAASNLALAGGLKPNAVCNATWSTQVMVQALAEANPYVFVPGKFTGMVSALGEAFSGVFAHSMAAAPWRIAAMVASGTAAVGTASGQWALDARADRGTNRLNSMPQGYATSVRPYENRTSNRPAEAREAVST